jgi:hypothetical protein
MKPLLLNPNSLRKRPMKIKPPLLNPTSLKNRLN